MGDEIEIVAYGPDEDKAIEHLTKLLLEVLPEQDK